MKPVEFHRAAQAELNKAVAFYEKRSKGLGMDFVDKVREGVGKIRKNPEAWPPHGKNGLRKLHTERFPYIIFYLEMPDLIWIVAVAHTSRRPDYWRNRQRK